MSGKPIKVSAADWARAYKIIAEAVGSDPKTARAALDRANEAVGLPPRNRRPAKET